MFIHIKDNAGLYYLGNINNKFRIDSYGINTITEQQYAEKIGLTKIQNIKSYNQNIDIKDYYKLAVRQLCKLANSKELDDVSDEMFIELRAKALTTNNINLVLDICEKIKYFKTLLTK